MPPPFSSVAPPQISQRAQALIKRGNVFLAIELCQKALQKFPNDAELLALLGYAHLQMREYEASIRFCTQALNCGVQTGFLYETLGISYYELERYDEARRALETAYRLEPAPFHASLFLKATQKALGTGAVRALWPQIDAKFHSRQMWNVYLGLFLAPEDRAILHEERARAPAEMLEPAQFYRLSSVRAWAEHKGWPVQTFGEAETIPIMPPAIMGPEGYRPSPGVTKTVHGFEPYVAELHDVTVLPLCSPVFTDEGAALNDMATLPPYGSLVTLQAETGVCEHAGDGLLVDLPSYEIRTCESGIFLGGLSSKIFGHWIPEHLMRLQWLEKHPQFSQWPLVVNEKMPPSHFDWLRALVSNDLLKLPSLQKTAWRFRKLLIASPPTFYPTYLFPNFERVLPADENIPLSPQGLHYLRERILGAVPSRPSPWGEKIYISRRNMKTRRLANDTEMTSFLEEQGFKTVLPETLSFEEQVHAFRHARVIVMPQGAAMMNLIFAPKDCKIRILFQPGFTEGLASWYGPLKALGYNDMAYVVGGNQASAYVHNDYTVSVSTLQQALDLVTEERSSVCGSGA